MKNIIQKVKNWLIGKLGGYTKDELNAAVIKAHAENFLTAITPWANVVREICRKGDNTYYNWCCDYCRTACGKQNGWCKEFVPGGERKQRGYTGR